MNLGRISSIASIVTPVAVGLAAGLAVLGCGTAASTRDAVTSGATATHVATTALTASTAPKFVLLGCAGLTGLHWTSWTSHLASGYGTYYLNDCTPTCAGGHFHAYPALVDLWGSSAVRGHPAERKFLQLTLVFTGNRPPAYQEVNGKTVVTHPVTLTLPTFP
jgi:hypothetical protein